MSDRQWEKLDGEPDVVRSKGEKYQQIADAIERASRTLDNITNEIDSKSLAMEKTRALAGEVSEDISKAMERYRYAGDALVEYATPLDNAISQSETAATRIAELEGDLASARTTAYNAQSEVDALPSDASAGDVSSANGDLTAANNRVDGLESSLAYWQGRWDDAKSDKNSAASTARSKIDEVVTGDKVNGLEDGTWDKIKDIASSIYKVFKIICDVAGILAIFLSWVPILGQILLVLAAIGAILSIVETIVKFAKGEIGWGGLLLGVGLGILGLFGGKLAGTLAKVAKSRMIVNAANAADNVDDFALVTNALGRNADEGLAAITEASSVVRNADNLLSMKTLLKSPFVRSDAAQELFELRKAGNLSFMQGLTQSAKEAFVFPLKSPFGDSAELLRMPMIFESAGTGAAAAVTMSLANFAGDMYKAGDGFYNAVNGGSGWDQVNAVVGAPTPVSDGPYIALAQTPGNIVSYVDTFDKMF